MPKIILSHPRGPYKCMLDTEAMEVTIKEAFLGVMFESPDGEKLSVCMRDTGFEVHYFADFGEKGFDTGWIDFKNGALQTEKDRMRLLEQGE